MPNKAVQWLRPRAGRTTDLGRWAGEIMELTAIISVLIILGIVGFVFLAIWREPLPEDLEPAIRRLKKTGRNDDCPCGSKKDYKDCHLSADEEKETILYSQMAHKSASFGNKPHTKNGFAMRGFRKWTRASRGEPPKEGDW